MASFSYFTSKPTFSGKTAQSAVLPEINNTDVVAPDVQLYLEGIQIPFESISVSQTYQGLPSAEIQVPSQSGLLDIIRGYEPKVHIFYRDDNYGGYRLLFWGHIKQGSYSRSRQQGAAFILFSCQHKNALLNQVVLSYSGWATGNTESATNPNVEQAVVKPNAFNSPQMIIDALAGITGVATTDERLSSLNTKLATAPTSKLDPSMSSFESRLKGMPGVLLNLWYQIKKSALTNPLDGLGMKAMYTTFLEEGLGFFKRMSGHTYLEEQIQASTVPYCHKPGTPETKMIVPPCFRTPISSAAQATLTAQNLSSIIGFSGEMTPYSQIIHNIASYCKYDIITLASPAEVSVDTTKYIESLNTAGVEKVAVETIVKPQMPFYYSPTCNVILPRMYASIQLFQDEATVPSRMVALHDAMPVPGATQGVNTTFLGPSTVREATAYNAMLKGASKPDDLTLSSTLGVSYAVPAKYEQGRGIKPERIHLPWWLAVVASQESSAASGGSEALPVKGTADYNELMTLNAEWRSRYAKKVTQEDGSITSISDPSKNNLSPYDPNNKVKAYERLMFSSIDYEFTERVTASRTAMVDCIFNPYIIPGYPMDVIDDNPNNPSFHGYCTSVTHTITAASINTSVSMVAVSTYAELSNFYHPPLLPYLQMALNTVNADIDTDLYANSPSGDPTPFKNPVSTLLQNPAAKEAADTFYRQVLGVGAASPDDLIHFQSGRPYPLTRAAGVLVPRVIANTGGVPDIKPVAHTARINDDYYTSVGNLRLTSRPIESLESIAYKFGYNFVKLTKEMYNSSYKNYVNPLLASNLMLEPGASLFLDYMEVDEFLKSSSALTSIAK